MLIYLKMLCKSKFNHPRCKRGRVRGFEKANFIHPRYKRGRVGGKTPTLGNATDNN
jgi:hypothetical protein